MQWSEQRERAFILTQQGQLSQKVIAAQVGVTDRTLRNWTRDPAWEARSSEVHEAWDRNWRIELRTRTRDEYARIEAALDADEARFRQRMKAKYGDLWKG